MPRNDAADRYSPDTAAALNAGEIRREATRKSDVAAHRGDPAGADQQGDSDDGQDREGDHGGVPSSRLGALRAAQLPPGQADQHRPRQHGDREPGDRDAERAARRRAPGRGAAAAAGRRGRPRPRAGPSPRGAAGPRGCARPAPAPPRPRRGARAGGPRRPPSATRVCGLVTATRRGGLFPARPVTRPPGSRESSPVPPHPESNSPRVAASSRRSRSSRAWRRLTGTSPTSVWASSPPLDVAAQLPHGAHGEQEAAVHADEPRRRASAPPAARSGCAPGGVPLAGVQADVVALRLGEADVVAAHEAGAPAQLDGHGGQRVDGRRRGGSGGADPAHPAQRGGEPLGGDRLEQVVDGADAVGRRGVLRRTR